MTELTYKGITYHVLALEPTELTLRVLRKDQDPAQNIAGFYSAIRTVDLLRLYERVAAHPNVVLQVPIRHENARPNAPVDNYEGLLIARVQGNTLVKDQKPRSSGKDSKDTLRTILIPGPCDITDAYPRYRKLRLLLGDDD